MNFVALDVETANSESAICQIGIAKFVNGILVEEWVSLINPEVEFGVIQTSIHKISENNVADKPKFYEVYEKLNYFLEGSVCVFHSGTGFDKNAIEKALDKYSLEPFNIKWIDSCKIARSVWPHESSHKLKVLCEKIGFEFKHHDALQDARACAQVLLAAIKESKLDFDTFLQTTNQLTAHKKSSKSKKISLKGSLEGKLCGEVVLFTGALSISGMNINEAKELVASCGADVAPSISKKVTLLVAGTQDPKKLNGKPNSTSYLTAEKYVAEGHKIRILNEIEFFELIDNASYE
jgi:DNA polymerase-3 subunit epsilon